MMELPSIPEPELYPSGTYPDGVLTYNADQLREYGESCARMAREEAAKVAETEASAYRVTSLPNKAMLKLAAAIRKG